MEKELETCGIRLNCRRPNIYFKVWFFMCFVEFIIINVLMMFLLLNLHKALRFYPTNDWPINTFYLNMRNNFYIRKLFLVTSISKLFVDGVWFESCVQFAFQTIVLLLSWSNNNTLYNLATLYPINSTWISEIFTKTFKIFTIIWFLVAKFEILEIHIRFW